MSFQYVFCGNFSFFGGPDADRIDGIKVFRWKDETNKLDAIGDFGATIKNQSILTIANDKLIAVNEVLGGGSVLSYQIEKNGSLTHLDTLSVPDNLLSYCVASPDGNYIFVTSMGRGSVLMLKIEEDGKLHCTCKVQLTGHSVTQRQSHSAVHSAMLSPDGTLLAAANLGSDEVVLFEVDYDTESIRVINTQPVDWAREPRHMCFSPSGKALYLLTEHGNRIYVYDVKANGLYEKAIYSVLDPAGENKGMAADIVISNDGKYLYSSNRGQNNVAVWKVLESGLLDNLGFVPCGGEGPRGLVLSKDNTELLCANNEDGSVTVLAVDLNTGMPGEILDTVQVPHASCVRTI